MTSAPTSGTTPAEPFPDGTRLVHIGLPKTGTSTIQTALHQEREALARHGVEYAGRRKHSYAAAAAALGKTNPWTPGNVQREWSRLARQVRTSDARCVVLSSETLSGARPQQVRRIVDELGGQVRVLVTLRALASVAGSNWQQGLRNRSTLSLVQWLEDALAEPPTTPKAQAFRRRFRVDSYLRDWGAVVGEDAMTFVIPDPADRGSLLRTVEQLLGVPAGVLSATRPANRSLPHPEAEFLRQFAVAYDAEGGDQETWMRTIGSAWTKARLRELRTPLEPHPIRLPRWAAERANELARPWIEDLRSSDATVIGDPAHLLVDPSTYDEDVAAPERMRIDVAAEIAHVLFESAQRGRQQPPDLPVGGPVQQPAAAKTVEPTVEPRVQPRAGRAGLDRVPARDLAGELSRRVGRRVRRR